MLEVQESVTNQVFTAPSTWRRRELPQKSNGLYLGCGGVGYVYRPILWINEVMMTRSKTQWKHRSPKCRDLDIETTMN